MANRNRGRLHLLLAILTVCLAVSPGYAQQLLHKKISLHSHGPVPEVLQQIGRQGGFYFSYNSRLLRQDSVVTVSASNTTVQEVLQQLFGQQYQYTETGRYIIIQPAQPVNNVYGVSGYVTDSEGKGIADASVYELRQLASAFTNEQGYFRLQLKNRYAAPLVRISRVGYADTSVPVTAGSDQEIRVTLHPQETQLHPLVVSAGMDRSWLSKLLLSSRQRLQNMNLRNFFAYKPFQVSLTPGLSTHGSFSTQVVNKFSLNALGGYTAGVNGFEAGGLFNINKKSARYFQLAGGLNVVGGSLTGFQLSVVHNLVEDTLRGVQIGGLLNKVNGLAAGVQIAPMCNYTKRLTGVQVALINIADSSSGYSIGLLNLVRGGYSKPSLQATDLMNTQLVFKTGTARLYSTLLAGAHFSRNARLYAIGWGLGHDTRFSERWSLSTEVNVQFIALSSLDNRLLQARTYLNFRPFKKFSFFAGPSYNWYLNYDAPAKGFKSIVSEAAFAAAAAEGRKARKQWVGWQAGITLESSFRPASQSLQQARHSRSWKLGIGFIPGLSAGDNDNTTLSSGGAALSTGGDIRIQKDYPNNISVSLSAGFTSFTRDTSLLNRGNSAPVLQPRVSGIPVKAGAKAFIGNHFYVGADAGIGFGLKHTGNFFVWTTRVGTELGNRFDLSLQFDTYAKTAYPNIVSLRLGYSFKLSRQ
jgi:hypothetical protein